MSYFKKLLILAAVLLSGRETLMAQEPATTETADSTAVAPAFNHDAPMFERTRGQKLYYIRKIHISGLEHLDGDIIKASAGLVEGDSIYLPSNFISNAITRLWSQRHFADVKVGADIEGDSLDLQVYLEERPRVYEWKFEGISTGKNKDLIEKLKLRRNSELSDYVLDKNQKLIKEYWKEKGFRNADVTWRIDQDSARAQYATVTFVIDKKERVRIGEINFKGNEVFFRRFRQIFHHGFIYFFSTYINLSQIFA